MVMAARQKSIVKIMGVIVQPTFWLVGRAVQALPLSGSDADEVPLSFVALFQRRSVASKKNTDALVYVPNVDRVLFALDGRIKNARYPPANKMKLTALKVTRLLDLVSAGPACF
jgi:hypothetical protein